MIPKVIHYCWLSGDPIPEKLQRCMDSWKKFLPDYEFVLWDLERFDINTSQWVKEAFEARKYAFAADYIRLYAVYNYGGVYMDMDVEVIRSMDTLLDRPYLFGFDGETGIEAGIFGAEPHNAFLGKCLDYYADRRFISHDGTCDTYPLPGIMYKILLENYEVEKKVSLSVTCTTDAMQVFPIDYFTAKSLETGKITVTKDTYTIHHFAGSWVSRQMKIKQKIYKWIMKNKPLACVYNNVYKRLKNW